MISETLQSYIEPILKLTHKEHRRNKLQDKETRLLYDNESFLANCTTLSLGISCSRSVCEAALQSSTFEVRFVRGSGEVHSLAKIHQLPCLRNERHVALKANSTSHKNLQILAICNYSESNIVLTYRNPPFLRGITRAHANASATIKTTQILHLYSSNIQA